MNPAERHRELVGRFLEGSLSDAEAAEFGRALAADPALADALARACRIDACLAEHFSVEAQAVDMIAAIGQRPAPRRTTFRRSAARWVAVAILSVGAVLGWAILRRRQPAPQTSGRSPRCVSSDVARRPYPDPQASGQFTVSVGESVRRGTVLRTDAAQRAALTLGGYCRVDVDPKSVVRVSGSPGRERIVLEQGRVVCDVEHGVGQFAVETELCTVSVKGTRFAVELLESQGGRAMLSKQVLVKVFAGVVLVTAGGLHDVVAAGEQKHVPGKVVITADSLPMAVGQRRTFTIATPEGQPVAEIGLAIVGRRTVGGNTLYRQAVRFGAMRIHDMWVAVGDAGLVSYDSFGAKLPDSKCPLPLKEGMAFEYESTKGKVRARVAGTETVEVPAGKFTCLVIVREREAKGKKEAEKEWMAPGVGTVKAAGEGYVATLARAEAPPKPKPQKGAVALNTFDTPDPLRSPLFPRAVWTGLVGEPGRSSVVDIEPFLGGANGTPLCLRWTYATTGTWASANMSLGGDGRTPVDLSKYKGFSFYIKSLFERPCTVTIHTKIGDEDRTMVHIPIQVTTEWKKVVLTPDTRQEMGGIDPSQVYIISLGDAAGDEGAANVIWLDEIKLLLEDHKGEF